MYSYQCSERVILSTYLHSRGTEFFLLLNLRMNYYYNSMHRHFIVCFLKRHYYKKSLIKWGLTPQEQWNQNYARLTSGSSSSPASRNFALCAFSFLMAFLKRYGCTLGHATYATQFLKLRLSALLKNVIKVVLYLFLS